jgi:hypothetical protein
LQPALHKHNPHQRLVVIHDRNRQNIARGRGEDVLEGVYTTTFSRAVVQYFSCGSLPRACVWLFSGVDTHVPLQMAATAGFVLAARPVAAIRFPAGVNAQVFTNVPPLQAHTDFTTS